MGQYNGPEEVFQQRLDYQTSGEITGSYDHSVSYGALGYFPESSFYLDEDDQKRILSTARATIDHRYIQTGYRMPVAPEVTPGLSRKGSAFVTVYRKGELQGCIGRLHEPQPLSMTIPELTLSAALEDPRFEPVHRGDIVHIDRDKRTHADEAGPLDRTGSRVRRARGGGERPAQGRSPAESR